MTKSAPPKGQQSSGQQQPSLSHLQAHGLSWNQHRQLAWFIALEALKVSVMAFIHGIIPDSFNGRLTASGTLKSILPRYHEMEAMMKSER